MASEWRAFLAEAVRRGLIDEKAYASAATWFESIERGGQSVDPARALVRRGLLTVEEARAIGTALPGARPPPDGPRGETTAGLATRTLSCLDTQTPVSSVVPGLAPVDLPGTREESGPVSTGKYELQRRLGQGGMGDVWLAVDRDLRREVAVKTIRDAVAREDLERFVFEAQVTGQLEHPNIVPVYELGLSAEDRQPYLVLKRVRGKGLDAVLDSIRRGEPSGVGRIDEVRDSPQKMLARVLDVFTAICQALAYAHDRGVIHRDLKPANVMVGEFGEVQIMDWGLAKVLGREEAGRVPATDHDLRAERPDRTAAGSIMGTPVYMPPEQARGQVHRLDERSDVYSLGAVLYEMVALARPFEMAGDLIQILEDVSRGRFKAPAARSQAPWEIPAEIEAVVLKAMARRPENRYASAALLRADIEAYRDGRTLGAVEYSPWQVLAKWVRRHRTAAIGAAATILAALLGIAAVVVVARHTRLEEEARVRSERIAAAEKRFEAAASRGDSSAVQFNPAVPQEWFLALLPVVEEMGRAIEEHPEPPQAWRRRLDEEMDRLQAGAEEVGDWALAEHLAQTADGWGVIPAAEREKRLARPAQVRLERARADVSRLEGILEMVSRADKDKRFGLLPGELEERAREIVRLPSRARVAQELLTRVAADNLRRERDLVWGAAAAGAEGGMSLEQRILAAEVLGRLKNVREIEGGLDAPGLVARTIRSALGLLLPADEVAAWIRAAGRLEAAEPECFPPPGVRELLDQAEAEYSGAAPVAIAAERVRLFWKTCLDRETLPADLSVERREALIEDLGDWAAARVSSGTDYTGYLVGRLEGSELAEPEERVLLDQIGLHGDASGPPGRSPVSPLRAAILDPPAAHLRDETSSGEGASLARRERRRAVRAATNLARLQVPETVLWLWSRLPEAGSRFGIDVGLALRLVPPERWPAGASVEEELHRAAALRLAGWPSEARIAASGIIERDPRSAEAYTIRSLARLEWGDIEGALADAQEALRLDPDHVEALAARAAARFESGDLDGGMSDYARVIALAPRVPEYLNDRATERGARGDVAGAVSDLERAAELAPESYLIQSNLADALQQAGELERALAAANRAIELDPSRGEGFVNRANILRRLGRLASALEDASAAALLSPGSWQAFAIRAVCRSDMGDVSGSLEDFDRALALESDDPSLLVDRGQSRKLLGREEEALDDFSRAIEIAPEHAPAWRRRAELRASRGDRTGAIEDWSRAIEADPTAESWTGRGLLRMKTGDVSGAIADLDEALQIDPGHVVALYSRGKAHLSRGDLARAKEDLARAAELDPQTWPALVELGEILAREGDTRGADRAFAQALERAHPAMHPEILDARRGALGR